MNDELKLMLVATIAITVGIVIYQRNKKMEMKKRNFWPAFIFMGMGVVMFLAAIFGESSEQFHTRKRNEARVEPNASSYSAPTTNTSNSKTCSWCSKSFSGKHYAHLGKMAPCESSNSESSLGKYCSMKCCSEARKSTCPTCR